MEINKVHSSTLIQPEASYFPATAWAYMATSREIQARAYALVLNNFAI